MNSNNLILRTSIILCLFLLPVNNIFANQSQTVNFSGREQEDIYYSLESQTENTGYQLNTKTLYNNSEIINKLTDLAQVILNIPEHSNSVKAKVDNKNLQNIIFNLNTKYSIDTNYLGTEILLDITLLLNKVKENKNYTELESLSSLVDKLEGQVINLLLEQEQNDLTFEF